MIPSLDARTRLVALLGDPVDHSLSPVIQNAAFRAAGVRGVYLALRCGAEELPEMLRSIARAGGAGNVTVPHKERAASVVDRSTDAVIRTGACNTFWADHDQVWGDNTDVEGFRGAVTSLLGAPPRGARVLLLGAGGAARAVLAGLEDEAADEVVILNRTTPRAEALAGDFARGPLRLRVAPDPEGLAGERFDLAVNATSLGLGEADPLPLASDRVAFGAALDLAYAPGGTAWVRACAARGIPSADGLEMLIRQGAAAFERWWGRPAPVQAMRDALDVSI